MYLSMSESKPSFMSSQWKANHEERMAARRSEWRESGRTHQNNVRDFVEKARKEISTSPTKTTNEAVLHSLIVSCVGVPVPGSNPPISTIQSSELPTTQSLPTRKKRTSSSFLGRVFSNSSLRGFSKTPTDDTEGLLSQSSDEDDGGSSANSDTGKKANRSLRSRFFRSQSGAVKPQKNHYESEAPEQPLLDFTEEAFLESQVSLDTPNK